MRETLLAAQGHNRVQPGGAGRRIEAEADSNRRRHADGEQNSKHAGHKWEAKLMGEQVGPAKTKRYRDAAANHTENQGLDQKLIADIGGLRPDSSAQADLSRALGHPNQHDIHNPDASDNQL